MTSSSNKKSRYNNRKTLKNGGKTAATKANVQTTHQRHHQRSLNLQFKPRKLTKIKL
jgi:hypothetical protein